MSLKYKKRKFSKNNHLQILNLSKNTNIITDLVYFLHKALLKQSVIKVEIVKV